MASASSFPHCPAPSRPRVSTTSTSTSTVDVLNLSAAPASFLSLGAGVDEIDSEDVTLVSFVLDMSGSMHPLAKEVIGAFNGEVSALAQARSASTILAAATTFADAPQILFGYQPLAKVTKLDQKSYAPNGSTALYDAVFGVMERLSAYRKTLSDNGVRSRAIVIVLSDGGDNASSHNASQVKTAAKRLLREEAVVLAYAGFGGDAAEHKQSADAMGFPHVLTAGHSAHDLRRVLGVVSQSVLRAAGGATGGASGGGGFF
jgi:uncharacterized protein YegL